MPKTLSNEDIHQFREAMRRVAENAFATRGAQGVTMRELAKELGCSAMTPYRYFRDKDEILAMVRAAAFTRFAQWLEAAARAADPANQGVALSEAYVSFALDEPHAYRLMFDLAQPDESAHPELTAASQRAWRILGAYFEPLVAAGRMEGDPSLIAYAYWAALHGFAMLALANKLPPPAGQPLPLEEGAHPAPTREAVLAQLRKMLWRGALPQPTPQ
jgi:AcrR family transcriptional regulator